MGKAIYNIIMFIVNFAFFLVGAAVMSFGIVLLVNPQLIENGLNYISGYQNVTYLIDLNSALSASGILLTTVGAVIMAFSLVGLMACCCAGSCLYIMYSVFLGLIIAFEIAVIIYSSVNYNNIKYDVQKYMYSALTKNFAPVQIDSSGNILNSTSPGGAAWETMQFTYGCCGAYGPEDFTTYTAWTKNATYVTGIVYPPSCCMQVTQYQWPTNTNELVKYPNCVQSANYPQPYLNTKGCYLVAMDAINQYGFITNIIIASLIALEVIILQLTVHQIYQEKEDNKIFA